MDNCQTCGQSLDPQIAELRRQLQAISSPYNVADAMYSTMDHFHLRKGRRPMTQIMMEVFLRKLFRECNLPFLNKTPVTPSEQP